MAVTVYRSTDASAPVLSGTVGALIGVLDACLVNGYGAKSPVGWAKSYSGTNLAAYRAPSGNRLYLRVDDTNAQTARVRGYESMSDVNTGTGPFPTDAQMSGGAYLYKSSAASSAARPWLLVSNGVIFYLFADYAASAAGIQSLIFGEFTSLYTGDAFNTVLIASTVGHQNANGACACATSLTSAADGNWAARSFTQISGALNVGKHGDVARTNGATTLGSAGLTYPASDGALWMSPIWVHETSPATVRGLLPGLYAPCHNKPLAHGDTFAGTGAHAARTFDVVAATNFATQGQLFVETSNTW